MTRTRGVMRRRPPPRRSSASARPASDEPDQASLQELDRFDSASLAKWKEAGHRLARLHRSLYFDLEPQRNQASQAMLDALRQAATTRRPFEGWCRIVDVRYTLTPLSVAGSVKRIGGRFNVGADLNPGSFAAFPALYIAEDFEAARRERLGPQPAKSEGALNEYELALRTPASFTQFRLRGDVEQLLDISDAGALKPFVDVIRNFEMPRQVRTLTRQLGFKQATWLIRSVTKLQQHLLHSNWRVLPAQYDLPSNSQIFGRLASAAGVHGILYPSVRQPGKHCLALFPQNWRDSDSWVEVADPTPPETRLARLDGDTRVFS